ncbi:hypothetical protein [Pontimicrobium sp. MEBiC06410]
MVKDLGFCKIQFYKNYAICNVYEGETICIEKCNRQTKAILNHFKNKPFVYITHRVNSYAVDPIIYKETSNVKSLIGFAVVSENSNARQAAQVEKLFLKKPFEIFNDLQLAIKWAETLLTEAKTPSTPY